MTRDEHRAQCFDAMEAGYWKRWEFPSQGDASVRDMLTAAFDALYGTARVIPVDVTNEMIGAASRFFDGLYACDLISEAGDLTNPPDK